MKNRTQKGDNDKESKKKGAPLYHYLRLRPRGRRQWSDAECDILEAVQEILYTYLEERYQLRTIPLSLGTTNQTTLLRNLVTSFLYKFEGIVEIALTDPFIFSMETPFRFNPATFAATIYYEFIQDKSIAFLIEEEGNPVEWGVFTPDPADRAL
ncbi:MAG TPA: hypothetical protein VMV49_01805, partial [Candidatus Deferrimicrobium sp.]|nr:hypothetical protein [Candidatus Deferrimicrobium sp.]